MTGRGRERWRGGDGDREGQRESNEPTPESADCILSSDRSYLFCVIRDNLEYDLTLFHLKVTNVFFKLLLLLFLYYTFYILNKSLFLLLIYFLYLYPSLSTVGGKKRFSQKTSN